MRLFCVSERILTPRRVGAAGGLDEEEDPEREIFKNLWQQRRLLPPIDSVYSKRKRWRDFLLVLVAYEQLYIPLQLAFQIPSPAVDDEWKLPVVQVLIQYLIDCCFLFDILLQFRTTLLGRPEEGSQVITDPKIISRHYTNYPALHRGRFLYDLIASVPIDLLSFAAPGGILGITGSWLRINRLLHMLRIISVHGSQIQKLPRPRKIMVYCILWFFLAHVTACAWWAIGVSELNQKIAARRGTEIWPLRIPFKGEPVTLFSDLQEQYWSSFYWSVTTLVKVPWVKPDTWLEQLFTTVIILIGTFTFSVIIGQVTMGLKALDMARQARSERIAKMRIFCNTRHVPGAITSELLHWTVADQDFSSKYVGRARLSMLPPSMRGPLLQLMYESLLESFPFKKGGMSASGCNALLIKLSPLVLTRGMGLIEPNSTSATLYVLQKGCLRIALPKEKKADGPKDPNAKFKHMRSARVSTSPVRGVKGGGLGLKSTKEFTRFRVLERPGACVGVAGVDSADRYPFHVDCTSLTHLFGISAGEIKQAMDSMSSDDREKCRETLAKEHKAHVDGLKYEPPAPTPAALPVDVPEASALFTATSHKVDTLLGSVADNLNHLRGARSETRQISTLLVQLGGDTSSGTKKAASRTKNRRGTVMNPNQKGMSRDNAAGNDYDELEERTGYSTTLTNANLATMTRAAIG